MKRAKWSVKNEGRQAEVYIYESIGEDWWGGGITSRGFIEDLNRLAGSVEEIIVRINSPGGDVFEGFAMYQALKRDSRRIVTAVDGLAASAASVVMVAGDEVNAAETSTVMIHDPWSIAIGNADEFREMARALDIVTDQIVTAYATRDQVDRDQIRQAMKDETWMSAADAKDVFGLVDTVTEASVAVAARVPRGVFRNAPPRLVGDPPKSSKPAPAVSRLAAARRALKLAGIEA